MRTFISGFAGFLALMSLGACPSSAPVSPPDRATGPTEPTEPTEPTRPAAPTVAAPAQPGSPVRATPAQRVQTPVLATQDPTTVRAVLDVLRHEDRERVRTSRLPVLLPSDPSLLDGATVMTEEHWYAVSIRREGYTVAIHSTDIAHPMPDGEETVNVGPRHRVRGVPALITENEGIRSASWVEGNVAYAVDVECEHPASDPRCTTDTFVHQLANSMVHVGGAR